MTRPRVLLADDHTMVAEGLRRLLEPEFDLVGIVEDGQALVDAAGRFDPDVIVADVSMPVLTGIEATQRLREVGSRAKVIILTMHDDPQYVTRAFDAGASGFVLKHSAATELLTAIREVLAGRTYVTPRMAKDLIQGLKDRAEPGRDAAGTLTLQQRKVLQLLAEGYSLKEVASALHISPRTAEFHKYRMMRALNLDSTAQLVRYAVKHGIAKDE